MSKEARSHSLLVVKSGTVTPDDITRARTECGITIIESSEPDEMRFLDPPPSVDIDEQARASLTVVRQMIYSDKTSYYPSEIARMLIRAIFDSSAPQSVKKLKPSER